MPPLNTLSRAVYSSCVFWRAFCRLRRFAHLSTYHIVPSLRAVRGTVRVALRPAILRVARRKPAAFLEAVASARRVCRRCTLQVQQR